jgi:hypothetical protein
VVCRHLEHTQRGLSLDVVLLDVDKDRERDSWFESKYLERVKQGPKALGLTDDFNLRRKNCCDGGKTYRLCRMCCYSECLDSPALEN